MGKRSTRKEIKDRVDRFCKMLIGGAQPLELHAYAQYHWGVSRTTSDRYIEEARALIRSAVDIERRDLIAQKVSTLDMIVRKAVEAQQYSNAIGAIRLLAELTGSMPQKSSR